MAPHIFERPEGYIPPHNPQELLERYQAGERYFEEAFSENKSLIDLSGANLEGANLSKALLLGANLVHANLSGTQLDGANLQWANLQVANLSEASLIKAKLAGARLIHSNLDGAKLVGVNFFEAIKEGIIGDFDTSEAINFAIKAHLFSEKFDIIPVFILIGDKEAGLNEGEELRQAVDEFMRLLGFKFYRGDAPQIGSYFKEQDYQHEFLSVQELKSALQKGIEAFSSTVAQMDKEVQTAQKIIRLLRQYHKAYLLLGNILAIKTTPLIIETLPDELLSDVYSSENNHAKLARGPDDIIKKLIEHYEQRIEYLVSSIKELYRILNKLDDQYKYITGPTEEAKNRQEADIIKGKINEFETEILALQPRIAGLLGLGGFDS